MTIKRSSAYLLAILLSAWAAACGTSHGTRSSARTPARAESVASTTEPRRDGYTANDGDSDFDDTNAYRGKPPNDDLKLLASYGPPAKPANARAIESLVKRYYAALAAEDIPIACSLLSSSLVDELGGTAAAASSQDGRGCAEKISQPIKQLHGQVLQENPATMSVRTVRVKGDLALVVLAFRAAPESEIILEREGRTWKIDAVFDTYMP